MPFKLKAVAYLNNPNKGKDITVILSPGERRHHWDIKLTWVSRDDPRDNNNATDTLKERKEQRAQMATFEWVRTYMAHILNCTAQEVHIEGARAWREIPD